MKNATIHRIIDTVVVSSLLILATAGASHAAQIDLETAKKVALYFGSQRWDTVSVYDFALLRDPVSGEARVYSFALAIGSKTPPLNNSMKSSISLGTEMRKRALTVLTSKEREQEDSVITVVLDSMKSSSLLIRQFHDFATVEVGAIESMPPFIGSRRGLPDWHALAPRFLETAAKELGTNNCNVVHFLWYSPLSNGALFVSDRDSILIDADQRTTRVLTRRQEVSDTAFEAKCVQKAMDDWILIGSNNELNSITPTDLCSGFLEKHALAQYLIEGVPYYDQDLYSNEGVNSTTCGPVSVGQVLGYHDTNYPNLVDFGSSSQETNFNGVSQMINDLKITLGWASGLGTYNDEIDNGTEEFCNDSYYKNNLSFDVDWDMLFPSFDEVKQRIGENLPMVLFVSGVFYEENGQSHDWDHFMTIVGYKETSNPTTRILIIHPNDGDNWDSDFYVNWDVPSGTNRDTYEFFPGGSDNTNPTCHLDSPNSGGTFGGVILVEASFSDASGLWDVEYQYSIDHSSWFTFNKITLVTDNTIGAGVPFNTYGIEYDPSVWVRARVRDNWGNYSLWDDCDQSFTVDNRGPQPSAIAVTISLDLNSTTPNSKVTATGSALFDTGMPVQSATITISTSENSWTAAPDQYGNYSRDIYAPQNSGWVTVTVQASGLTGSNQAYLTVTPDGSGANFVFERSTMTPDVQASEPYDPIGETRWFRSTDEIAYCWVHLRNLCVPVQVKWEWYKPDGTTLPTTTSSWTTDPQDYGYDYWYWWKFWSGYYISGYSQADTEGRHSVKISAREEGGSYKYMESQYYVISYDFKEHRMCKTVQTNYPYDCVNPTKTFYTTDSQAATWALFEDVSESVQLKWEFYQPSGALYTSFEYTSNDPGQGYYYEWYKLYGVLVNSCVNSFFKQRAFRLLVSSV